MLIAMLDASRFFLNRTRCLRALVGWAVLSAAALAALPAAGFVQQGNKLTGIDAATSPRQGSSAALSADGNTALVGGRGDNGNAGTTWVYIRDGNGVWTQQGAKLVGNGAVGSSEQGVSAALSADGNTALIGGPNDNSLAGAAWVFTRDGNGVWTQQGPKLFGTGAAGNARQGASVALSSDGNTALIGGPNDNNSGGGAAWVFVRDGNGVWTQQGDKLTGNDVVGPAQQGGSVALSADGNTALVGGNLDNGITGAAWVYIRDGNGVWTQQGGKLVGTGAAGSARQGSSVALSSDGNTAIVGGKEDNGDAGAAWVYIRNGNGVWTQQGAKLVGSGAVGPARQGVSVALAGDGNTALVGGDGDSGNAGATWVFRRTGAGVWTQVGQKRVGSGAVGSALQGNSVALSSDGNTALVGGPTDNSGSNVGAAWVFGRPGIAGIVPDSGSVAGGDEVVIFGVNLFNVTGVTFGGLAATNVTPLDAEIVIVTTPSRAAGRANVDIATQAAGAARLPRGFLYEAIPTVTNLTSSVNPSQAGRRVVFRAFVSGVGRPARGKVVFKNGAQTLGTVNLRNGVATFRTDALTAGAHPIKAFFLRNGMFAPSRAALRQRVTN
jgi:hypothetical protein